MWIRAKEVKAKEVKDTSPSSSAIIPTNATEFQSDPDYFNWRSYQLKYPAEEIEKMFLDWIGIWNITLQRASIQVSEPHNTVVL
jgi:hypothetical protein